MKRTTLVTAIAPIPKKLLMKRVLTSVLAGSLLATLAVAQPSHSAAEAGTMGQIHGRWTRTAPRPMSVLTSSDPNLLVYVVTNGVQFGVEDLRSGKFAPIGPGLPPEAAGVGLVPSPGKPLLTLAFTGDLIAINPATGATSLFGKTGLGDCSTPASPCGPNSAGFLGNIGGNLYATDFANNLYSLDSKTGAAQVIGLTGIPPYTFSPNIFYDESLFSFRGKLYANFETVTFDPGSGQITPVIPDALYEIDTKTGKATYIAPTTFGLITIVTVSDTVYGFDAATGQIVHIDMTTGQTTPVSEIDPAIIIAVCGATPAR
jgi:hypothetical protein